MVEYVNCTHGVIGSNPVVSKIKIFKNIKKYIVYDMKKIKRVFSGCPGIGKMRTFINAKSHDEMNYGDC